MKFSIASWASLALLAIPAFALPGPVHETNGNNGIVKRDEPDRSKHIDNCIDDIVNLKDEDVGKLTCSDQRSADYPEQVECSKCLGLDGNEATKSEKYLFCSIVTKYGDDEINPFTNRTACPGDDVPETDPDGNPSSDIAEGIVDAWCAVAGSGGFFGWVNMAACYSWVFATSEESDLEQAKAGVDLLCNSFLFGLCSCLDADVCG
ncbi:hypothetical protein Q7P37_007698 [Cladosporium fusiforme]